MEKVIGLFQSREEGEHALNRLKAIGISIDAISVAMKESLEANSFVESASAHDVNGRGVAAYAVSGAAVGTLVGLALLGSTVVFPGIGTFLVAGPFAAAAAGAGIGAASGGMIGALTGAGIPEYEAQTVARGLEEGQILLGATVPDAEVVEVMAIFEDEGSLLTRLTAV
jgi:uncharacterized membrane protein